MKHFTKTPTANLYRSKKSGTYFMFAKIHGEQVRQSLKTKSLEIARLKLADAHKDAADTLARAVPGAAGEVSGLMAEYIKLDEQNKEIKASSKRLHRQLIKLIKKTWPELESMEAAEVSDVKCFHWAEKLRADYSPTWFNSAVMILRQVLDVGVRRGLIVTNPARSQHHEIKFAKVKQRELTLLTTPSLLKLLLWMKGHSRPLSARMARLLAWTGMRIGEASKIDPSMIRLDEGLIRLPGKITKSGKPRDVPIIDELKPYLAEWLDEYAKSEGKGPLLPTRDINDGIQTACKAVEIKRITHHDLRHLFATHCLELGVDVKTVAEWLGHQDGGVLLLKTYAHLRNEHSQSMSRRVRFGG